MAICVFFSIYNRTFPESLLHVDWGSETWFLYKAWALARSTGRFALCLFGADVFCTDLDHCPLCGAPDVRIEHALYSCQGASDLFDAWAVVARTAAERLEPISWDRLRMELFAGRISFLVDDPEIGEARILFVGGVIRRCARAFLQAQADCSVANLINEAAAAASGF